jgi:hypothetical protein
MQNNSKDPIPFSTPTLDLMISPKIEKGDVAQNHQNYFALSSFRIAMAIAEAPTPK